MHDRSLSCSARARARGPTSKKMFLALSMHRVHSVCTYARAVPLKFRNISRDQNYVMLEIHISNRFVYIPSVLNLAICNLHCTRGSPAAIYYPRSQFNFQSSLPISVVTAFSRVISKPARLRPPSPFQPGLTSGQTGKRAE